MTQSHGLLLVCNQQTLEILQVSDNSPALFDILPQHLLKEKITTFLKPTKATTNITKFLTEHNKDYKLLTWHYKKQQQKVWVYITRTTELILLEVELIISEYEIPFFDLAQDLLIPTQEESRCRSINELANITCKKIQTAMHYDRVLIYQLDIDKSTLVVGEAKQENMAPFMGLHFPSEDIPKKIRNSYLQQPIRYIPDLCAPPTQLIPEINPLTNKPTDLTTALLKEAPVT